MTQVSLWEFIIKETTDNTPRYGPSINELFVVNNNNFENEKDESMCNSLSFPPGHVPPHLIPPLFSSTHTHPRPEFPYTSLSILPPISDLLRREFSTEGPGIFTYV